MIDRADLSLDELARYAQENIPDCCELKIKMTKGYSRLWLFTSGGMSYELTIKGPMGNREVGRVIMESIELFRWLREKPDVR